MTSSGDNGPRVHEVFLSHRAAVAFLDAAARVYVRVTRDTPYACFAVLVGAIEGEAAYVERVEFARNVRASSTVATTEYAECIIPQFGEAYRNRFRGFWCDSHDLLRIARDADAERREILGPVHLHPDFHRFHPGTGRRLSERPTPMDEYVFRNAGWPVNLICYLEHRRGALYQRWASWGPAASGDAAGGCSELLLRVALSFGGEYLTGDGRGMAVFRSGSAERIRAVGTGGDVMTERYGSVEEAELACRGPLYVDDPHRLFAGLRDGPPVRQVMFEGARVWLVTGYEETRRASADLRLAADPRRANAAARALPWVFAENPYTVTQNMLRSDPPRHTRLRRSVAAEFTASRVDALRPRIQAMVDDLVNRFLPTGCADLITDFARRLPLTVICEVLGVPGDEREEFARLAAIYVEMEEGDHQRLPAAVSAMRDHLVGLVDGKLRRPVAGGGLLDRLASSSTAAGGLDRDDLVAMSFLLLVAGFETTTNLIGNGVLALLAHPDSLDQLRRRPDRIATVIDEVLRWDGPIKVAPILRFTTEETDIGSIRIPGGGEPVLLAYGAASRDPQRFNQPDQFDINRDSTGHLGFGHGAHRCLGAGLGRAEAEIAVATLVTRCTDLALAVGPAGLAWGHSRFMRGLTSLPVTFTPVPASAPQPRSAARESAPAAPPSTAPRGQRHGTATPGALR